MKFLRPFCVSVAAFALATHSQAAVFSANFESSEGYNNAADQNVAGQNGWVIDDAADQLSFFQLLGSASNNAAGFGGYYTEPATGSAAVSHPVNEPLDNTTVRLSFSIQASTADFPGADSFSVNFDNDSIATNFPLFSIAFEPFPSIANGLAIVWYDAANTRTASLNVLFYDGLYDLTVSFTASGADTLFSARVADQISSQGINFNGVLPGASAASLDNLGVGFKRDAAAAAVGDNYILFDNINVGPTPPIPEPSAVMAIVSAFGCALMRRRR
jgi:hypothetical protein